MGSEFSFIPSTIVPLRSQEEEVCTIKESQMNRMRLELHVPARHFSNMIFVHY
jgi:hypothetical protein